MKISLFSPSSPSSRKALEQGLSILRRELGLMIEDLHIVGEGFSDKARPNPKLQYIAALDEEKALEFQSLVCKKDLQFILCCRGGYGAMRWLPLVDWDTIGHGPQVIGFSDVTVLLAAISRFGGTGIHGPMLNTLCDTRSSSRQALWDFMVKGRLPQLRGVTLGSGVHEGMLVGGNLTCLCHLIGTPFEPEWEGVILFLEDCNEPMYRLDRMLTHMSLAGVFDKIGGLCLGQFIGENKEEQPLIQDLFMDRLSGFRGLPILADLPIGHGDVNLPLKVGSPYKISGDDGLLSPLERDV